MGLNLVRATTFYLLATSPYWHCSSSTKSVNGDGSNQEKRKYKCAIPLACMVLWQYGARWWCGTLLLLLCGEIHATLIRHRALVLAMFLTSAITTDTATALLPVTRNCTFSLTVVASWSSSPSSVGVLSFGGNSQVRYQKICTRKVLQYSFLNLSF